MTVFNLILFIIIFSSCVERNDVDKNANKRVTFTVDLPKGWQMVKDKGIDSDVGLFTNSIDTLNYDYGWFPIKVDFTDSANYVVWVERISGVEGIIRIEKGALPISAAMFMTVNGDKRFRISGKRLTDTAEVFKVFRSIRFPFPDSAENRKWIISNLGMQSGSELFSRNCASCHSLNKDATGPSIQSRLQVRSVDWVYNFLTNRKDVELDSERVKVQQAFPSLCDTFPELTKNDIQRIIRYCAY